MCYNPNLQIFSDRNKVITDGNSYFGVLKSGCSHINLCTADALMMEAKTLPIFFNFVLI